MKCLYHLPYYTEPHQTMIIFRDSCLWYYRFRGMCKKLVDKKWFDNVILLFIALNCITLAMERPNIPPDSTERMFLSTANYIFTVVFAVEMFVKVQYHCYNFLMPNRYLRLYHRE